MVMSRNICACNFLGLLIFFFLFWSISQLVYFFPATYLFFLIFHCYWYKVLIFNSVYMDVLFEHS